jgi:biotin operon repressor
MKKYQKAYMLRNPEKFKVYSRKYHTANREKKKTYIRAWRLRNPEKYETYRRAWRLRNPEKWKGILRESMRKHYAANREKMKKYQKAYMLRKHGCIECKNWPDAQRGYSHYDGMCFRCFSKEFPHDERVKTRGRVELRVRSYLDSHFPDFVHDQPIHTAHCVCSHRRRIDHRRLIGNTLLCVETDENFHKYYDPDDEEARYHDVIMAWGGKLCFVRFNPHKFNLDDRCDHGPPLAERLERLRAEVTRHIGRLERGGNTAYLEVHHLYYPKGTPDLYEEQSKPEWLGGTLFT